VETPPGCKGRILVVDDDPQVRALAARALAADGFDVLQAPDGLTALDLLSDPLGKYVGLVVTDIVMPRMQGDELGRRLHQLRPTLPILYMSAHSRPVLDFLTETELARCWISKPFSIAELLARCRERCVTRTPAEPG
jgi:DNA-binding response OmpR family regulator